MDLPEPDSPTSATFSPGWMASERPLKIGSGWFAYLNETFSKLIAPLPGTKSEVAPKTAMTRSGMLRRTSG